jgi:hypothetical protein
MNGAITLPHTQDKAPCLPRLDPAAHHPIPLSMYSSLHVFIFPLIPFRGSGGVLQPLPCVAGGFGYVPGPLYGFS